MKKADLHVHTDFSDGTLSPKEVVLEAKKREIACIAICDHDCIEALEPASDIATSEGIELVPGVELTAERGGCEIHILGYYIDLENPLLLKTIGETQKLRVDRIYEMIEKLKKSGIDIKPEEVFKISGKGSVGRLHLAYAIHNNGYTRYISEAFRLYIGEGKPCYVGKFNLNPAEAISLISQANGVPVLAHPGVMGKDNFIGEYVKNGLKGIEAYHSDHRPGIVSHYIKLAKEWGLLVTGGSDCHGLGKGKVLLGDVNVDYSLVEELKKEANKIKNKLTYKVEP